MIRRLEMNEMLILIGKMVFWYLILVLFFGLLCWEMWEKVVLRLFPGAVGKGFISGSIPALTKIYIIVILSGLVFVSLWVGVNIADLILTK
jgi:hypothetical protein